MTDKEIKAEGLLVTLAFDSAVVVTLYTVFVCTRRAREKKIRGMNDIALKKSFPDHEPGFFKGLFYWAWKTMFAGPKTFQEKDLCIDAQCFLMFERYLMQAFIFLAFTATPVLVLVNFLDPEHGAKLPEALYVSDVHVGTIFLWAQLGCLALVTVTMWLTLVRYRLFLTRIGANRRIFSPLTCRTLHITDLPKELNREVVALEYMERNHGLNLAEVEAIHLVPRASGVLRLLKRLDKLSRLVDLYKEKGENLTDEMKKELENEALSTVKDTKKRCGCWTVKLDASKYEKRIQKALTMANPEDYFQKQLDKMYELLEKKMARPFEMTGNAFLSFRTPAQAVMFGSVRRFPLQVMPAPEPDDVEWAYVGSSFWQRWGGRLLTYTSLLAYMFFVGSPVAILAMVEFAALEVGIDIHQFLPFGTANMVNSLLLMIISASIPYVVKAATVMELNPSVTELMQSQLRKVVFYNLLVILIFPTASLTSLNAFTEKYMDNRKLDIIGDKFLNGTGLFFLIYCIHSSCLPPSLALLRIADFLSSVLFESVAKTPQEMELAAQPSSFNYVMEYSSLLTVMAVVLSYGCIIPAIIPVGMVYFMHRYFADRYNLLAIRGPLKGGMGAIPRIIVPISLYILVLYQAIMVMFVGFYGNFPQLYTACGLLLGSVLVLMFQAYYFRDGSGFDDMTFPFKSAKKAADEIKKAKKARQAQRDKSRGNQSSAAKVLSDDDEDRAGDEEEGERTKLVRGNDVGSELYVHPIFRDMTKQTWYSDKLFDLSSRLQSMRGADDADGPVKPAPTSKLDDARNKVTGGIGKGLLKTKEFLDKL